MEVTRNSRSVAAESIEETSTSQEPERGERALEMETSSPSVSPENAGAASKIGEHAFSGSLIANDLHSQVNAENSEPKKTEEPKSEEPKTVPTTFEDILFLLLTKYAKK